MSYDSPNRKRAKLINSIFRMSQTEHNNVPPVTLTIAGSDPSGGAGIQADLKTFHQHGVFGTSAITLLTVQNTQSVSAVEMVATDFVGAQLNAVLVDLPVAAAKTGNRLS